MDSRPVAPLRIGLRRTPDGKTIMPCRRGCGNVMVAEDEGKHLRWVCPCGYTIGS